MLVGDPNMRSRPDTKLKRQNCYRCYTGPNFGGDFGAPCMDNKLVLDRPHYVLLTDSDDWHSVDSEALPNKVCAGGIRSNILFPT